jgi:hypothetical protein
MKKRLAGRYKKGKKGSVINKFGVEVSKYSYNRFKELNKQVERKRQKLLRKGGKVYGEDYKNYFGKQTRSLHAFETIEEFRNQMKKLRRISSPSYEYNRKLELLKNYKKKAKETFSSTENYRLLKSSLDKLTIDEFIDAYQNDQIEAIEGFYETTNKYLSEYEQKQAIEKVQKIINILGK